MRRWLSWTCLLALSGAFLYAGALKIVYPRAFQESILDYQLVGLVPAALLAWWLPWFEVMCAIALWWPRMRLAAAMGVGAMLLGFLGAISAGLARGLSISCGCFGAGGHDLWIALAIDAGLLLACGVVCRFASQADASTANGTQPSVSASHTHEDNRSFPQVADPATPDS
jgi:putative oxidoreductase